MQVFLPFPDYLRSVRCLDKSRLGNQIWRECKTLISGGWANHPVAKMWAPYKHALAEYSLHGLNELLNRGHIHPDSYTKLSLFFLNYIQRPYDDPPFLGDEDFHLSHRLNLLWKDPTWYSNYFTEPVPTTKPDYIWPSPQKIGIVTGPEL